MARKEDRTLNFNFYTLDALPPEERKGFKLPANPYNGGIAIKYLKDKKTIFYRDSDNDIAIIIQADDGNPTPIKERKNFVAYAHAGVLDKKTLEILKWEPKSAKAQQRYKKIVGESGDDLQWLYFNKQVRILEITEEFVRM